MSIHAPLKTKPLGYSQERAKAAAEKMLGCKLMSTREVAKHYNLSSHQVMNLVRKGRIPRPVKFQNCNYFVASQHITRKRQMQTVKRAQVKQVLRMAA